MVQSVYLRNMSKLWDMLSFGFQRNPLIKSVIFAFRVSPNIKDLLHRRILANRADLIKGSRISLEPKAEHNPSLTFFSVSNTQIVTLHTSRIVSHLREINSTTQFNCNRIYLKKLEIPPGNKKPEQERNLKKRSDSGRKR